MIRKILLSFFLIFSFLFAKEVPLNRVIKIILPIGVPSILEFPFKIRAVKATSFIYKVKVTQELSALQAFGDNDKNTTKKNFLFKKQLRPIIISRTNRSIIITPKKEGRMSLIIWGYKYPIILDVRTRLISTRGYDRYYIFLDYSQDKQKATQFEATSHEKVITKLIRYIYNNKIPPGYTYQVGTLDYVTHGIRLIQVKSLVGNRYRAEEWVVENLTNHSIILYPQMFYNNNIYAITFENNKLGPKERVRMFIVAKNISKP